MEAYNCPALTGLSLQEIEVTTITIVNCPALKYFDMLTCSLIVSLNLGGCATTMDHISVNGCELLTTLTNNTVQHFDNAVSGCIINGNISLATLSFASLIDFGTLAIYQNALTTISMPLLQQHYNIFQISAELVTSLSFPAYVTGGVLTYITANPNLVSVSMPNYQHCAGDYTVAGNPVMTTFACHVGWNFSDNSFDDFTGNDMNQATVDAIFHAGVIGGMTSGTIDTSGGTNSPPSAGTIATDIAILTGAGVTCVYNP